MQLAPLQLLTVCGGSSGLCLHLWNHRLGCRSNIVNSACLCSSSISVGGNQLPCISSNLQSASIDHPHPDWSLARLFPLLLGIHSVVYTPTFIKLGKLYPCECGECGGSSQPPTKHHLCPILCPPFPWFAIARPTHEMP